MENKQNKNITENYNTTGFLTYTGNRQKNC